MSARLSRVPRARHAEVAAGAKDTPAEWVRAGTYRSRDSARGMVRFVTHGSSTTGGLAAYDPPGAFEAETRDTEFDTELWIRYVGPVSS